MVIMVVDRTDKCAAVTVGGGRLVGLLLNHLSNGNCRQTGVTW